MKKERVDKLTVHDVGVLREQLSSYPPLLFQALAQVSEELGREMFLIGGTIRDWLLRIEPNDLDFTVECDAVRCCRLLIHVLDSGTFVPLGTSEEDAGRVVWQGLIIDFSSFREGTETIAEDLCLRDYTLNALGVSFTALMDPSVPLEIIDPLDGMQDLREGILRCCPNAFTSDPLRMLRGYRLWAKFGFLLEKETVASIYEHAALLSKVSVERISYEMALIMASDRSHEVCSAMAESGLLFQIIPALQNSVGVGQPPSHHLDVFGHSLAALENMEKILAAPEQFYPLCLKPIEKYLQQPGIREILKWSALLHDLGKPATQESREDKDNRITFYNHDEVGRELVNTLGHELRWSGDKRDRVAGLTGMHMHPFHLCNIRRKEGLSKKACLKLAKRAGEDLIGLFLLSMADSLASKGELRPEAMEKELQELLCEVMETYLQDIEPALRGPRLVTGNDLIEQFSLTPGPLFSKLLNGLQEAQVEGEVTNRAEALSWIEKTLKEDISLQS